MHPALLESTDMTQLNEPRARRVVLMPTPEEDAAIDAGIAHDPDTSEPGAAEFKRLRHGRPLGSGSKVQRPLRGRYRRQPP